MAETQVHPLTNAGTLSPSARLPTLEDVDLRWDSLDQMQSRISPYIPKSSLLSSAPPKTDPNLSQEILDTVDEIRKNYGQEPVQQNFARRLQELLARISEIVERHIFHKQNKNQTDKEEIEKKIIPSLQSWMRWQASSSALPIASPLFLFLAQVLPQDIAQILQTIGNVNLQGLSQLGNQVIEAQKTPLDHKRAMHVQTASSTKQAEEGIKNLPAQVQQLVTKLIDLILQMVRTTGQR